MIQVTPLADRAALWAASELMVHISAEGLQK
jgi:hypothetical protein